MMAPDFITVGSVRLVSLRAVAKELGGSLAPTKTLLAEMGVPVRDIGDGDQQTPYVGMWVLEHAIHEWLGGDPSDMGKAALHYAELTRVSLRARLREILKDSRNLTRRTKVPSNRRKKVRRTKSLPKVTPI